MNNDITFTAKTLDINLRSMHLVLNAPVEIFSKMNVSLNLPAGTINLVGQVIMCDTESCAEGGYNSCLIYEALDSHQTHALAGYLIQTSPVMGGVN